MNEELSKAIESIYDSLTDEQKEKAGACTTMDELLSFAGAENIELPDEALDVVAGGSDCGSTKSVMTVDCMLPFVTMKRRKQPTQPTMHGMTQAMEAPVPQPVNEPFYDLSNSKKMSGGGGFI